jgi:hypothetical protein
MNFVTTTTSTRKQPPLQWFSSFVHATMDPITNDYYKGITNDYYKDITIPTEQLLAVDLYEFKPPRKKKNSAITVDQLPTIMISARCGRNCCIISWKWDISDRLEPSTALLQCLLQAKAANYEYCFIDIISLPSENFTPEDFYTFSTLFFVLPIIKNYNLIKINQSKSNSWRIITFTEEMQQCWIKSEFFKYWPNLTMKQIMEEYHQDKKMLSSTNIRDVRDFLANIIGPEKSKILTKDINLNNVDVQTRLCELLPIPSKIQVSHYEWLKLLIALLGQCNIAQYPTDVVAMLMSHLMSPMDATIPTTTATATTPPPPSKMWQNWATSWLKLKSNRFDLAAAAFSLTLLLAYDQIILKSVVTDDLNVASNVTSSSSSYMGEEVIVPSCTTRIITKMMKCLWPLYHKHRFIIDFIFDDTNMNCSWSFTSKPWHNSMDDDKSEWKLAHNLKGMDAHEILYGTLIKMLQQGDEAKIKITKRFY